MPKRKNTHKDTRKDTRLSSAEPAIAGEEQVFAGNMTLHELFQRQAAAMIERADLSDEQKQTILIGMNCPCCGAGGMSFTAKLKP